MANQVEIDVVLNGAEEASRGLNTIGETSAAMADRFAEGNDKLGEGLGSLVGNVEELGGSFVEFGSTVDRISGQGVKSLASLLPALGGVAAAGYALYETFLNISGAAAEAEQATEAMSSAASDLQSRLESLTENGIKLSTKELQNYTRASLEAEFSKTLLETKMSSLKSVMEDYAKSTADVAKAERVLGNKSATGQELIDASLLKTKATKQQTEANEKLNKGLAEFREEQSRVMKLIQKRSDLDEKYQKTTKEAILADTKANIEKRASIQLLQAESNLSGERLELVKLQIEEQKALALLEAENRKENAVSIKAFSIDIKESLKEAKEGLSEAEILLRAHETRQVKLIEEAGVKEFEARRKTKSAIKGLRVKSNSEELALARRHEQELRMIRALELQSLEINGANQLDILRLRYEDELKLAKDSLNAQRIARLQYENAIDRIVQDDLRKDEEREKKRIAKAFEIGEFDLNLMKDGLDKEIALMELRYEKERQLSAKTESDITEINRRAIAERQAISDKYLSAEFDKLKELGKGLASAGIEAAYGSIIAQGEFRKSVGEAIFSLGQQAAVQAVFQGAEALALLATGNVAGAAIKGKAAAAYAGVATVAGVTASKMGVGGSSGGGSKSSPSAIPQKTERPEREQADSREIVYNINFGGAVIYDTKTAAEQALADRLTNLQNRTRRGSPQRRA